MNKINNILKHPIFNLVSFCLLLVVLFLLLAGFTNFNFKIGDFNFAAGKGDNTNLIRSVTEVVMIQTSIRPSEQISYMKDKVNQMIDLILQCHIKLLQKHGVIDYFTNPQYIAYKTLVENALNQMKDNSTNRFLYMATHFNESNIKDFKEYAKNTATEFITSVATIIQDRWVQIIITKEENFEWTRQLVPSITSMIIDIFDNAFEIQMKYQNRIKEIEKTYRD